jgi:endonuclease III
MRNINEQLKQILIKRGQAVLDKPLEYNEFTEYKEADDLLNNLDNFPHAFFLSSLMTRQITAERAWLIPYRVAEEIGGFEIDRLLTFSQKDIKNIFNKNKLHRFNDIMADSFYLAVQKIHSDYNDNASKLWKNKPASATIIRRILEFKGAGIKVATMVANILARNFKIPMKDHICIDISPDVHLKRVFERLGFVSSSASSDELIYSARELNPEYPGIFDLSCWEIGRNWCRPSNPKCSECYLNKYCPKIFKK